MPLNEKQTRFAHAYIACGGNGRAAAIQAGYSHTSAAKRACDLLKVSEVQDIVQTHRDVVLKATENFDVVEEPIGLYRMSVACPRNSRTGCPRTHQRPTTNDQPRSTRDFRNHTCHF